MLVDINIDELTASLAKTPSLLSDTCNVSVVQIATGVYLTPMQFPFHYVDRLVYKSILSGDHVGAGMSLKDFYKYVPAITESSTKKFLISLKPTSIRTYIITVYEVI